MAQCTESKGNTPGVICDCIHVFTRSWLYLEATCAHMVHTGSSTSSARRNGIASLHLLLQYSLTLQWSLKLLQHLSAMDVTSLSSHSCPTVRILVMLPRSKKVLVIIQAFHALYQLPLTKIQFSSCTSIKLHTITWYNGKICYMSIFETKSNIKIWKQNYK